MSDAHRAIAPHRAKRPTVALVTRHWGGGDEERAATARLVAGALSRHAEVEVVHLSPTGDHPAGALADSVFRVHRLGIKAARPERAGIAQAALTRRGTPLGAAASALLDRLGGQAPGVAELLDAIEPRAVVLVGHDQPWDHAAWSASGRVRLSALPLLGDSHGLQLDSVCRLLERCDVVLAAHPGEARAVQAVLGPERAGRVRALDLAFTINRAAVRHRLFGVRWFGRYVVLLRGFPAGAPRLERTITHEMLRAVLGRVSVAEVDIERWRITDGENTLLLPVNPSRVNLWRLMEHAVATIDVRPGGPLGREAIESMLLGTPVLVPDATAAMEHARAASGGLWFAELRELVAATRAMLDYPLRNRLAAQGEAYALAHHGEMAPFVEHLAGLVLG
ncbi:MAG: hypothetical protein M0004_09580 [Actinomycetota bacterium]|nr:hypothetical protein [Actinomycetota bacterium]